MGGVPGKVERLIKLREAAERLGISRRTVYRLCAAGRLPVPVAVTGRARAFCESDIDAYIERIKRERGR